MRSFFSGLRKRNGILYWYGWLSLLGALVCGLMTRLNTNNIVLGIDAWIKPAKFFFSIWIFCWTMAWYLWYLDAPKKQKSYSWMVVIVMSIELSIIAWQAANGRLSHFNISTPLYARLFDIMGGSIVLLTLWTGYIDYLFFKKKFPSLKPAYVWGIRLGILFFVIFSLEGGVMAGLLKHTVGEADGGPGLPVFNWSRYHGDLRISHFFGIHSLQVLPLTGYFLAGNKKQLFLFAALWFTWVLVLLVQALYGIPAI